MVDCRWVGLFGGQWWRYDLVRYAIYIYDIFFSCGEKIYIYNIFFYRIKHFNVKCIPACFNIVVL